MAVVECKENQDRIVLFLYEELTEREQTELEKHLQECGVCNDSFEQQKSFHAALAEDTGPWNVPSDLLVESRRALANELDRIERKPWSKGWWRLPAFSFVVTPMRLLEWTTLVAVGLAAGVYLNSSVLRSGPSPSTSSFLSGASGSGSETVSNLRIVNADTTTGNVELIGDMVRPMHFQGNIMDETVQQLLVGAMRDGRNPSSRMSAVELLSRQPDSRQVKEALIRALIEDDNLGVRLKALQTLKPFANKDKDVQAAFMNALAYDEAAGVRVQAIEALRPFAHDDSVSKTVQEVTKDDDNPYIKLQAIQFVGNSQ
jgi:tRNA threonylcarbamoyladenosine modification (KEOPS) complex Cgi121 subunit